jgi:NAD(P)-dependent dehydrogenase (short-subunit alcohol dehydrogenase family)
MFVSGDIYYPPLMLRVCFVKCNVASKEEWYNLWDEAEKQLEGKIEILCNNAGVSPTVSKRVDDTQDLHLSEICSGRD